MAIRKLSAPCYLRELNLNKGTLRVLEDHDINIRTLITMVRNDVVWASYYPTTARRANLLTQFRGIGDYRAKELIETVDKAGFILHESEESRRARRLLAIVLGTPTVFMSHYEDLEDMSPEALMAVDITIQEPLDELELQVIRLTCGLEDGAYHTLRECADALDITIDYVRKVRYDALRKLGEDDIRQRLEVATCYSREALSRQMAILRTSLNRLQLELDTLQHGNPYPDLEYHDDVLLEELDFSRRTFVCLKRSGINRLGELCSYTEDDLLLIRNFAPKNVAEVREALHARGLDLARS